MRYRYIKASCTPTDKICKFRLLSHRIINTLTHYPGDKIFRVYIPDDLKLEKYSCDIYATTEDTRTIEELGYDIIITMWNGKQKIVKNENIDTFAKKKNKKTNGERLYTQIQKKPIALAKVSNNQ